MLTHDLSHGSWLQLNMKVHETSPHQTIISEIPLPQTFLNAIFNQGWQGVLHVLHFPQGEKIFTSIDLIKDPSSTNFPPCNFLPRVSYTFYIFHIERKYEQLYHYSFSVPSKSLKKRKEKKKEVNTLFFTIFSFFLLLNFLLFLNPQVDEILFIYLFIYNSTLCWYVLVLYFLSLLFSSYNLCWS